MMNSTLTNYLDSKLSENSEFASRLVRLSRKRRREAAVEESNKRAKIGIVSIERFAKLLQEHCLPVSGAGPSSRSPSEEWPVRDKPVEMPFISEFKEEPPDDYNADSPPIENNEPQLSLSISETNRVAGSLTFGAVGSGFESCKLRAKLGLKPLDVGGDIPGLDNAKKEILKPAAEVSVKTENISEIKRQEALHEKIKVMKEKHSFEARLQKTKGVADSDSEDESIAEGLLREEKEKRAKLLKEMDEKYVEEKFHKSKAYTSKHLKGFTVGPAVDSLQEGLQTILTLKDKGVLEEEEDILENVNLTNSDGYAKNVENKKKPD